MSTEASLVGTVVDRISFPVEMGKIREFAIAVGEVDPVYLDAEAARAAGHRGIPAPPTFAVVAGHWRDQGAMVRQLGLDIRRVVVGEVRWRYLAPVHAGDQLTGTRVVRDVVTREGRRGGQMRIITLETEFVNQDGVTTVRQSDTLIETEPA